jgi:NADPH2:quinone reductase
MWRPWPFVPGYESVGIVDAVGTGVTAFQPGRRVAALTVYGKNAHLQLLAARQLQELFMAGGN